MYLSGNELYFVLDGNQLVRYTEGADEPEILYFSVDPINYYVPYKDVGVMIGSQPPVDSTNSPYTTMSITSGLSWNGDYYFLNYTSGVVQEVNDPDHLLTVATASGISDSSYTTTINGKAIPCPAYPVGSDFQQIVNGSKECHVFGFYILSYLYGSYDHVVKVTDSSKLSIDYIVDNYPIGTFIRAQRPGIDKWHTMIYIGSDSSGIYVYHANWDNDSSRNLVSISHIDWSEFSSGGAFPGIAYIYYHQHDYGSWSSHSSSQHKSSCSTCGNTRYANHTMGNSWIYHSEVKHKKSCSGCGYTTYANHTFGSNGRCTVCNGYVSAKKVPVVKEMNTE